MEGIFYAMVGIFYGHLANFTAIFGTFLWPFGIFYGYLVRFAPFWYAVPRKSGNPAPLSTRLAPSAVLRGANLPIFEMKLEIDLIAPRDHIMIISVVEIEIVIEKLKPFIRWVDFISSQLIVAIFEFFSPMENLS
jgi:hypothetical protein